MIKNYKLKALAIILLTTVGFSCTKNKKHEVTFNFDIESTNGNKPLKVSCFDAKEAKDFMEASFSGENAVEPKPLATFKSEGKPEKNLSFTLNLPETETFCLVDPFKPMIVRNGPKAGDVFVPRGPASIKFNYNMYSSKFFKVEQEVKNVDVITK